VALKAEVRLRAGLPSFSCWFRLSGLVVVQDQLASFDARGSALWASGQSVEGVSTAAVVAGFKECFGTPFVLGALMFAVEK
jgi:hypothetical protein